MQRPYYHAAAVTASLVALSLGGCKKQNAPSQDLAAVNAGSGAGSGLPALPAALPMQAGPPTAITVAPPISAIRPPRHVGLGRLADRREVYAYLDRASDVQDEIGDAPPDYAYDDDGGVSPWVWQTNSGEAQYAEPVDGGYRYYYYQPRAREPYLVRDRHYSYAYAGGVLVAIYALNGALVPPDRYAEHRDDASRYYWRAQQLQRAAQQREHRGVVAANWAARSAQLSAARANWAADRAQQAEWQDYHAQHEVAQREGWQAEHQQRQIAAQQFAGWQSHGFAGPAPQFGGQRQTRQTMPGGPAPQPGSAQPAPRQALIASHPMPGPGGPEHPYVLPVQRAPQPAIAAAPPLASHQPEVPPERHAPPQHLAARPLAPGFAPASSQPNLQQALQQHLARQQALTVRQHAAQAAAAQQQAAQNLAQQSVLAQQRQQALAGERRQQEMAAQQWLQTAAAQQHAAQAAAQTQAAQNLARQNAVAGERRQQEMAAQQRENALAGQHAAQHAAEQQQAAAAQLHRQALMAERQQAAARAALAPAMERSHPLAAVPRALLAPAPAPRPEMARPPVRPPAAVPPKSEPPHPAHEHSQGDEHHDH
jgi:hypothetical protein